MARTLDLPASGVRSYGFQRETHAHNGIDLQAGNGAPVYAAAGGIVRHATHAWQQGFTGYGKVVSVDADDGTFQLYAHLSDPKVRPGERVSAGQLIAAAGRTGFGKDDHASLISHAHLHFEVAPAHYPLPQSAPRLDPIAWLARGNMHPISRVNVGHFPPWSADDADQGTAPSAAPLPPASPPSEPSLSGLQPSPSRSLLSGAFADRAERLACMAEDLAAGLSSLGWEPEASRVRGVARGLRAARGMG